MRRAFAHSSELSLAIGQRKCCLRRRPVAEAMSAIHGEAAIGASSRDLANSEASVYADLNPRRPLLERKLVHKPLDLFQVTDETLQFEQALHCGY